MSPTSTLNAGRPRQRPKEIALLGVIPEQMPKKRLRLAALAVNRQRAESAGREQADRSRRALVTLQSVSDRSRQRWIDALQHRVDHPDYSLRRCAETMTPPMSKHQYFALLRRAWLAAELLETKP